MILVTLRFAARLPCAGETPSPQPWFRSLAVFSGVAPEQDRKRETLPDLQGSGMNGRVMKSKRSCRSDSSAVNSPAVFPPKCRAKRGSDQANDGQRKSVNERE